MSQPSESQKRVVLPYAVIEGRERTEEFPQEMTFAAILADVEKRRAKAGIIRKQEETITFVSTLNWPIIVVPWREGRHLVFDGMAVWSFVFEDRRLPSSESFVSAVAACKNYKDFIALESAHSSYFKDFVEVDRLPVMGLFIHEEFMKDLLSHIALARPREVTHSSFLEPRLPMKEIESSVNRIAGLATFGKKELEGLTRAKESLSGAVDKYRKEIDVIVETTRKKFAERIEAIRPDVAARVSMLERMREETWTKMQPRLLALQSEVRRQESEESHWAQESKRKDMGPDAAAKARERLSTTRGELAKARDDTQKYQEEMARVRTDYDKQIQGQWDRIRSLERERDTEVSRLLGDQNAMTQKASQVFEDMEKLKKKKEDSIAFVESQGVQVPPHIASEIVFMPLMVCSLLSGKGVRYVVYPPMIARAGKGVIGGIQSMFGGLVLPLEPKTKQFDEVFRTGIEQALTQDQSLATYIGSKSMSVNILHMQDLPGILTRGLAGLKNQGWIKDKHEKELLQSLQKHILTASATAPPK